MQRFFAVLCAGLLGATPLSAATRDFLVRAPVGNDVSPPTTPTLVSAIPISPSQIDLTWSPATDDFQLLGYTVSRDGLHIATTTLTTYSDTGLLASTTYTYTVRAFDWLYNVSSSSNELATTTLSLPVPLPPTPAPTSTSGTASGKLMLQAPVTVTPGLTTATFAWSTSRPSRFALRWGRTPNYELGYITTDSFRVQHNTTVTDLLAGTLYYYEILGFNPLNNIAQPLASGQFTTRAAVAAATPPNVADLNVTVVGLTAQLSWQNPPLPAGTFSVRVVRNHLGYPLDPYDGMVIYQGTGVAHTDQNALVRQSLQYYTVYVIDQQGRWSSGALAQAQAEITTTSPAPPFLPATSSDQVPVLPPDIPLEMLTLADIIVIQDESRFDFTAPTLTLHAEESFSLLIPAARLPSRLKSIVVTLLDPSDYSRAHRFLLRRNDAGTAYEATIAPVRQIGISQLLIEIYDFEALVVGRYGRQVTFFENIAVTREVIFPDQIFKSQIIPLLGGGVGLLSGFLLLLSWRRREDKT